MILEFQKEIREMLVGFYSELDKIYIKYIILETDAISFPTERSKAYLSCNY